MVKTDPELQVPGSNWKKGKVFLLIRGQTQAGGNG